MIQKRQMWGFVDFLFCVCGNKKIFFNRSKKATVRCLHRQLFMGILHNLDYMLINLWTTIDWVLENVRNPPEDVACLHVKQQKEFLWTARVIGTTHYCSACIFNKTRLLDREEDCWHHWHLIWVFDKYFIFWSDHKWLCWPVRRLSWDHRSSWWDTGLDPTRKLHNHFTPTVKEQTLLKHLCGHYEAKG